MDNTLLNIPAAAAHSGLSAYQIRAAIAAGRLYAYNIGTGQRVHLRIRGADLAAYLGTLPQAARRA